MTLIPYSNLALRWRKVCKHVFDPQERWWDVFGDLATWAADWNRLRAACCLDGAEGALRAEGSEAAQEVLARNHDGWVGAAERAVAQARAVGRVFPQDRDKALYVGEQGVTVVVAAGHLVTCYRPGGGSARLDDAARTEIAARKAAGKVPEGWQTRAAVRRPLRRASLDAAQYARRGGPDDAP